jgi:hypothetical protein
MLRALRRCFRLSGCRGTLSGTIPSVIIGQGCGGRAAQRQCVRAARVVAAAALSSRNTAAIVAAETKRIAVKAVPCSDGSGKSDGGIRVCQQYADRTLWLHAGLKE